MHRPNLYVQHNRPEGPLSIRVEEPTTAVADNASQVLPTRVWNSAWPLDDRRSVVIDVISRNNLGAALWGAAGTGKGFLYPGIGVVGWKPKITFLGNHPVSIPGYVDTGVCIIEEVTAPTPQTVFGKLQRGDVIYIKGFTAGPPDLTGNNGAYYVDAVYVTAISVDPATLPVGPISAPKYSIRAIRAGGDGTDGTEAQDTFVGWNYVPFAFEHIVTASKGYDNAMRFVSRPGDSPGVLTNRVSPNANTLTFLCHLETV